MSSTAIADAAADNYKRYEELASALPSIQVSCFPPLSLYQGCWFPKPIVAAVMAAQDHFVARPTDLFLCSFPKSGTTWLKALMFCVLTRADHPNLEDHPILRANPHTCVRFLEEMFASQGGSCPDPVEPRPLRRILSTHMPYSILPESIKRSVGCRIVYVCREPKDTLTSYWKFATRLYGEDQHMDLEEYCKAYLRGECSGGPIWDHMLGFWRESRANPNKVLFLKYEEIKKDGEGELRRLASFMGCPFSAEEEAGGVVRRIVDLCSFASLSKLEVNVSGRWTSAFGHTMDNSAFFGKGRVGGWTGYLTPETAKRIDDMVEAKLRGSGLTFGDHIGS